MRLREKCALITGGGSGFGKSTALLFASEGASVAVADLNLQAAEAVCEEIRKNGGAAVALQADVSKEESVRQMVKGARAAFSAIDILVNSAGLSRTCKIQDLSLADWQLLIDVNLTGTFLCCREVIQEMIDRGSGKIVNIASIAGMTGRQVGADYSASKAGVIGLTRALAAQVAKDGVNVNAIAPGPVATPLFQKNFTPDVVAKLMSTIPYKRWGSERDIANLILFLSCEEGEWITGEVVSINGGAFMG